jgi:hypothetical protein
MITIDEMEKNRERNKIELKQEQLTKFNALKHGILSKHTVLPWENRDEYEKLLHSLIEEYNPKCATEENLVEELAGVVWKKGRLRYAERAYHQQALNSYINPETKDEQFLRTGSYDTILAGKAIKAALLRGYTDMGSEDVKVAVLSRNELKAIELESHKELLSSVINVSGIIESNATYEHALSELHPKLQESWRNKITEDCPESACFMRYEETLASLKVWLKGCKQCCEDNIEILENQNKIKDQILGQIAISNDGEEKLLRYEIHLDRKLERILSMLLKLQHIKGTAW